MYDVHTYRCTLKATALPINHKKTAHNDIHVTIMNRYGVDKIPGHNGEEDQRVARYLYITNYTYRTSCIESYQNPLVRKLRQPHDAEWFQR